MFEGEKEGLKEILKTNTVKVPTPIKVLFCGFNCEGVILLFLTRLTQWPTHFMKFFWKNANKTFILLGAFWEKSPKIHLIMSLPFYGFSPESTNLPAFSTHPYN